MIRFYKDGDAMGISTDCVDEDKFVHQFANAISTMIDGGHYEGDWYFQLTLWLPCFADVCCKLRGHDSNVTERVFLCSGHNNDASLVASWSDADKLSLLGVVRR